MAWTSECIAVDRVSIAAGGHEASLEPRSTYGCLEGAAECLQVVDVDAQSVTMQAVPSGTSAA
jgi:hypothetical protein